MYRCGYADRIRGGLLSSSQVRLWWADTRGLQPTGTSSKFVTMMCQALESFQEQHKVRLERVTQIPLEGEGTISKRVEKCVHRPYRVVLIPDY